MVSDDEKIKRTTRAASDNDLLRPRKSEAISTVVAFDDTASNGGIRSSRHHSAAVVSSSPAPAPAAPGAGSGPGGVGGKTPKPPGWSKKTKSARGLFFRSGTTPKTQHGESPTGSGSSLGKGLAGAAAAGTSAARKTFRSEST